MREIERMNPTPHRFTRRLARAIAATLVGGVAVAALPAQAKEVYELDPEHTFPSFTSDHFGGASTWRGKFTKTAGRVELDRAARKGSIEVTIDMSSVDMGHAQLEEELQSPQFFDTARYPTAEFKSTNIQFKGSRPIRAIGTLTMHGVTRPVTLTLQSFKCYDNPILKKRVCGTDATAVINRDDFGISYGKDWGFSMKTGLQIQIEAVKQ